MITDAKVCQIHSSSMVRGAKKYEIPWASFLFFIIRGGFQNGLEDLADCHFHHITGFFMVFLRLIATFLVNKVLVAVRQHMLAP